MTDSPSPLGRDVFNASAPDPAGVFIATSPPLAYFWPLMRAFLVGIVLVVMCGSSASGQATGFVQQIGFQNQYRPSGWTPLLVNLQSTISDAAEYQIQVRQEDLDRDRVVFRRDIVLNPQKQELFWVYFLAQPRGLGEGTPADLAKLLDVRLCSKVDGKPLVKLNIQFGIQNLDPPREGYGAQRGVKLVLCVTDGPAAPPAREFADAYGTTEDVVLTRVSAFDLPENVLGYDAVDAVVWFDADAGKMTTGGSRRLAALTEYVRDGGRLVVCQPTEKFKIEALADLVPVEMKDAAGDWLIDVREKKDLRPVRDLARYAIARGDKINVFVQDDKDRADLAAAQEAGWNMLEKEKGPFQVAFAKPKPGAVGEEWIDWKGDGSQRSPWLVRQPFGLGAVTWVAQDLGDARITGRGSSGWPYVWDRVLGHRNVDMRVAAEADPSGKAEFQQQAASVYRPEGAVDLGAALLSGMEHTGRAGGLIFLAGVFFVGYWLVAGPVSYLVLAGKKRTDLSWTIFGASALVATLLTIGVVRLVLRGDAELHHVSLVRLMPAGKDADGNTLSRAVIDSRIGLYIPRDYSGANQGAPVKLLDNDEQAVSYVTPFSVHPLHQTNAPDFPAYLEYQIPVRDNPLTEPVQVGIPYRSTLKKLQARWAGHLKGGVDVAAGPAEQVTPRLVPGDKQRDVADAQGKTTKVRHGTINGVLVNRTGSNLAHVFIVFHHPGLYGGGISRDGVLYLPDWADGAALDLGRRYNEAAYFQPPGSAGGAVMPGGGNTKAIRGQLGGVAGFEQFWFSGIRNNSMGSDAFDDARGEFIRAFPMLSLYDRLEPQKNDVQNSRERVEVLRRAARGWDVSEQVAAGQLVVLALAGRPGAAVGESPLPFPMEVEGDVVTGTGTTFYQFSLPLGRGELPPAWESEREQLEDESAEDAGGPPPGDGPPAGDGPEVEVER